MTEFKNFKKTKEYMVCVDSDGCAMDTMNIKHIRCFGPCMVKEWNLWEWEEEILKEWNRVNLYAISRGINRFVGLATALVDVNQKYTPIDGADVLMQWTKEATELSNRALEEKVMEHPIFQKALHWSMEANKEIENLPKEEIHPFEGVKEALKHMHEFCNIAVVSSANPEAVKAEWGRFGLLNHVDLICAQDMGNKEHCIRNLVAKGYANTHVLMCGDALGDCKAAEANDVLYFPIKVNHEVESWTEILGEPLRRFCEGTYQGEFQERKKQEFMVNLQ